MKTATLFCTHKIRTKKFSTNNNRLGVLTTMTKNSSAQGGTSRPVKIASAQDANDAESRLAHAIMKQAIESEYEPQTLDDIIKPKSKKSPIHLADYKLNEDDLSRINTNRGLTALLKSKNIKLKDIQSTLRYEDDLVSVQIELVKLQRWVQENGKRVAILFEGRDAAGKGGTIRRFTEHLNPRSMRVVALPKPSQEESGQCISKDIANNSRMPAKLFSSIVVGTTAPL